MAFIANSLANFEFTTNKGKFLPVSFLWQYYQTNIEYAFRGARSRQPAKT